jgi:hypothetical protein
MLSLDDALKYVNLKTGGAKKYREYAVSDFSNYVDSIKKHMPPEELQKTWALYLKWAGLCTANPQQWSSANGQSYATNEPARKFNYTINAAKAPTLGVGAQKAVVNGVGQCEYFATQAFAALKLGGKKGTVPRVDKIATPGHNWVLVNYSPRATTVDQLVAVDYWLLALGVARDKCICAYTTFVEEWGKEFALSPIKPVGDPFNPDNQD